MPAVLRSWSVGDAASLVRIAATTPDLGPQTGDADLASVASAQAFIVQHLLSTERSRVWAIDVDGDPVGTVGLGPIDRRNDTAWAFYWLASAARGRGLAHRALVAACDRAFADGLHRIELGHRTDNPASCAVATRAGFRVEGLEREKLRYGDRRFDVELHARLRTDPTPSVAALPVVSGRVGAAPD